MEITIPWTNDSTAYARQFTINPKGQFESEWSTAQATPKENYVIYDAGTLTDGITYTTSQSGKAPSDPPLTFDIDKIILYSNISVSSTTSPKYFEYTLTFILPSEKSGLSHLNIVLNGTYKLSGHYDPNGGRHGTAAASSKIILNDDTDPVVTIFNGSKRGGGEQGEISFITPIELNTNSVNKISFVTRVSGSANYGNYYSTSEITQNITRIELLNM